MSSHRKKTKNVVSEEDAAFDQSINELAEVIVEELKEHHTTKLEPFELYTEKIRMKIHENFNQFRHRFSKGYHLLLDEIERERLEKKP